jgi:hypothetical protein
MCLHKRQRGAQKPGVRGLGFRVWGSGFARRCSVVWGLVVSCAAARRVDERNIKVFGVFWLKVGGGKFAQGATVDQGFEVRACGLFRA